MEANPAPNTPRDFLELISDQDVSGEIPWSLFTSVRRRGHQVGEQNGASISSLVTVRSSVESASVKFPPQHPRRGFTPALDLVLIKFNRPLAPSGRVKSPKRSIRAFVINFPAELKK
jgi:hypothetical protein